jgi:Rrf2 family protein
MTVINRETDYALRALIRLGEAEGHASVSALAEATEVPEKFLRKIMQRLHRAGMVESRQGPFGGYRLAQPLREVSVLDVVEVVQGPVLLNECFAAPDICEQVDTCPLRERLGQMQGRLRAELSDMRLSDVAGAVRTARKGQG